MLACGALGVALTASRAHDGSWPYRSWTVDLPADAVLKMRTAAEPATGAWLESGDRRPREGRWSPVHGRAGAVASTAWRMSWVAASGWDTNETCEAATSTIVAFARSAMNR
jgi:hypothetical protein